MIEVHYTGKCENCNCVELVLDRYETGFGEVHYDLRCIHREACDRLEKMKEGEGQ